MALVSGGKDSCFAMMECVRYGHEIACLAHLRPPAELAPEAAEIDSFMYQSVGHNVVALIAESMALPLVTGTITGTAVTTEIDYPETKAGDEVEDLFRLLQDVRARHPDVQGVCTGAIFSSYQRNRVESVYAMARRHLGSGSCKDGGAHSLAWLVHCPAGARGSGSRRSDTCGGATRRSCWRR